MLKNQGINIYMTYVCQPISNVRSDIAFQSVVRWQLDPYINLSETL